MTLRDRVERRLGRLLATLPDGAKVLLSRRPPVVLDGQTLDPDMQLVVSFLELTGAESLASESVEKSRAHMRHNARVHGATPERVARTADLTIPGPGGRLAARHYVPDEPGGPHPLLVFLHGGGFVLGDLDTHDAPCRILCAFAGVHVLSIDYRLAPEHPFPAAVDDARAALSWALANAGALGADPARVAIGGDSAGGNLSAVACHAVRDAGGPQPAAQLLLYPSADRTQPRPSLSLFADGFLLTRGDIDWFHERYSGGGMYADPRISPLLAPSLAGLPRALVVTAGFDPLRDEGEAYAAALAAAGTPTVLRRFPSLLHGFVNITGPSRAAREATVEIAGALRAMIRA